MVFYHYFKYQVKPSDLLLTHYAYQETKLHFTSIDNILDLNYNYFVSFSRISGKGYNQL